MTPRATHGELVTTAPRGRAPTALAEHVVLGSTIAMTAGLLGLGSATGQLNWQVYAAVMTLGIVGVRSVHRRVGLSPFAIWGLALFGIGHVAGGMVPVGDGILYQWWLVDGLIRYDNVQHAWGFGFVGLATWEALRHRLSPREEDVTFVAAWVIVLAAAAFGAVNEIGEYVLTLTLADTNVGGYANTARDLLANLVGGLVVSTWTVRRIRRST